MGERILDSVATVPLLLGVVLMGLGAAGLLRMPDVYTRAQAASKTSTLGLALVFLSVALHFGDLASVTQAVAVVVFAFLSVPVAAHMITRAAHRAGIDPWPEGARDDLREAARAGLREPTVEEAEQQEQRRQDRSG